jgi:ABC-type enterobactin transport system permease subunit
MRSSSRLLTLLMLLAAVALTAAAPARAGPTLLVGTTIAMRFSNPLTPGRPLVRLPLR